MKPKVYIETTIISYLAARPSHDLITVAHQQITRDWWDIRRGDFDLFVSQLVWQEATSGDEQAIHRRQTWLQELPLLQINQTAIDLAKSLISDGALPEKAAVDALHIAIAAVNGMDYLLTWNLKHLANAIMRNVITSVCRAHDYEPPVICTPEELLED